ncbi:MAG TPA: DUF3379 family protein [Steroidobacteraceae bacterium]|nr:DUF3379 family protein [Steroidobacteraceae bacterium]
MSCEQARLHIGADPAGSAPELEQHLQDCESCRQFRAEMRSLDANIRRALERPPVSLGTPRFTATWRPWALAASVLLAMVAVLAVWLLRPSETLARDVVAHVQEEPESWLARQHVDAQSIDEALRGAGVKLDITSDRISYAQSCWFRGHYVPHLVVQTAQGPATVMILRNQPVSARRTFHEGGMSGVIVPAPQGSIAVLTRGGASVDALAAQMQQDVRWLPDAH